ncbi:hypothetical protein OR263_35135 [Streptomyces sp. NEAU-H22]|uniref:hypothetical protein n=1 Tax=unclassified Streptomyces TaxID=2593676 RepID=UPI0022523790|nr:MULTISPECIES: hypothetical protein [unclassified Streptomyces]MCX3291878.1 hypothetical protein [Streptomyces sp. NEAU-H22]WMD06909.1 hypothetical protein Q7C01_22140 [Streptomyces sp. FXY-T5]
MSQPRPGVHVVTCHDDVRDVLTDHEANSSVDSFAMETGGTTADLPAVMITTWPRPTPRPCARLRRWFAPAVLREQEARARDIVTDVRYGQATAMTIGYGLHACFGAPQAPLESRVVLERSLERFPELRLAPGYRREPAPGLVMVRRPARLDGLL